MKSLAIGYSSKCNNNCAHCIARPAFPSEVKMSFENAKDIILQAKSIGTKKIWFTLGEPFLYIDDIKKLVSLCNSLGIMTRIVTNAFWASNSQKSDEMVKEMGDCGLTQLRISASRFHQTEIDLQNVINAAQSCVKHNLDYYISFITDYSAEDEEIGVKLKKSGLNYSKESLICFGEALESKKYKLPDDYSHKCKALNPIVTPDLKVYVCCGIGGYFDKTNFFYLGDLKGKKLSEINETYIQKNRILDLIRSIGLVELAKIAGFDANEATKMHRCILCEKLFNSVDNIKKIEAFLKQKAV